MSTAVLVALCRWLPYPLLVGFVGLLLLDRPIPAWLVAALAASCLALLGLLARRWPADG